MTDPFQGQDYRGFIFLVHERHGLMLLQCTRKKDKPLHWQLPGGHVDADEFKKARKESPDPKTQLLLACRSGAARELFEETGIDMRGQLDRLEPAFLRKSDQTGDSRFQPLANEVKQRVFFFLPVSDSDFMTRGVPPVSGEGLNLKLRLSVEHSGFKFEPEPEIAAEKLKLHSGGKCSQALRLAMSGGEVPDEDLLLPRSVKRRSKRDKDTSVAGKSKQGSANSSNASHRRGCFGLC